MPHDPAGFAESVLNLLQKECPEDASVPDKLDHAVKALAASNLDFSRYGVELFEIFFAGARMGIGTKLADDTKQKISWNVRPFSYPTMAYALECLTEYTNFWRPRRLCVLYPYCATVRPCGHADFLLAPWLAKYVLLFSQHLHDTQHPCSTRGR